VLEPDYPLETERLRLRPYTGDDFAGLFAMQSDEASVRWLYWGPRDEDAVRHSLARKMRATAIRAEHDSLGLAGELKATGEHVADFTLWYTSAEHRQGEIGFMVHPDHQRRGYATEGGRVLLALAFEELGLHRVAGRAEARNTASARVLERLGMRREAHLVENEWVKGEWQSELIYAMLDREWRA
jgi:RimJ/RimL family protein N-acetyltransferase